MKKTGILQSLNVSPRGSYEGFLLKAGKEVIQVNLHKGHLHGFEAWTTGSTISVEVEAEEPWGEPVHKVFQLLRFVGDGHGDSGETLRTFSGRIASLNYALHGEVNGGILDSGDFLHLKPEGAKAIGLEVDMMVKARGKTKPMIGGNVVIEAEEVNGTSLVEPKDKKKRAK